MVAPSGPDQPRRVLQDSVFALLDKDGDGFLGCTELRRFADIVGFEGSAAEWSTEYEAVMNHIGPLRPQAFARFTDDRTEDGCDQADADRVAMLASPQGEPTAGAGGPVPWVDPRVALIDEAFRWLDCDGDGALSLTELRPFANNLGFDGDSAGWHDEYRELILRYGPMRRSAFAALVNDGLGGAPVTDAELGQAVAAVRFERCRQQWADRSAARPVAKRRVTGRGR